MTFAVELYTSLSMCASLRGISDILMKSFRVNVSHETIRQWVLSSKHSIDDNCIPTKTWHIDETYIKIKGKGYWLWVVRCKESNHVIAWHISKKRLLKDARAVLKKAMLQTQGIRPKKIITDGLYQYVVAIKKEVGWNWRVHKKRHIVDSGIGKNYFIERLNREIKRRIKWFSTFQALDSAKAFFGLWFYHFNTRYLT
jgi:transposase-like protein